MAYSMTDELRRVKRLRVGAQELLSFVGGQAGVPHVVTVIRRKLPEGCLVTYLGVDPLGLCVEMLVWHSSFPVVPLGMIPPDMEETPVYREMYALATEAELRERPPLFYDDEGRLVGPPHSPVAPPLCGGFNVDMPEALVADKTARCQRAWEGGYCRRNEGHDGPCAVVPFLQENRGEGT